MFLSYACRCELAKKLKQNGFYVRMHAYDYLLGKNGRIIGVLTIEPTNDTVYLYFSPLLTLKETRKIEDEVRKILSKFSENVKFIVFQRSNI